MSAAVLSFDLRAASVAELPALAAVILGEQSAALVTGTDESAVCISGADNAVSVDLSSTAVRADSVYAASAIIEGSPRPSHAGPPVERRPSVVFGNGVDAGGMTVGQTHYVRLPYGGTIQSWQIVASSVCSCEIDVWRAHEVLPTSLNSITGNSSPVMVTDDVTTSNNVTSWNRALNIGDVLGFKLESFSGSPKQITLTLIVQ